jgi:hypothetical protein
MTAPGGLTPEQVFVFGPEPHATRPRRGAD